MVDDEEIISNGIDHSSKEISPSLKLSNNNEDGDYNYKTIVLDNELEIYNTIKKIFSQTNSSFDLCLDYIGPSLTVREEYKERYLYLIDKKVKIRFITEITKENIRFCKEILKFIPNFRHLEGVKGNFAVSDEKTYLASLDLYQEKSIRELIYSNVKRLAEHHKYLFEMLWNKAVPAEKRIIEIEEGSIPRITRLIDDPLQIGKEITSIVEGTKIGLSNCFTSGTFQVIYNNNSFYEAYKKIMVKFHNGQIEKGIRWITHIEDKPEKIKIIKEFLRLGIQIKHVRNLPPISFGVSEKQLNATIERPEGENLAYNILVSTEPLYIQHFNLLFEELWKTGINAEERIRSIENHIDVEGSEIIENTIKVRDLFIDLIKASRHEVLIIFPSMNAIDRQNKIGVIHLLEHKAREGVNLKILAPSNDNIKSIFWVGTTEKKIEDNQDNSDLETKRNRVTLIENIEIRKIHQQQGIKSTILIVDKKYLLAMELKDDSQEDFEEAIGLATYSTSRPTILSNIALFESLWIQIEFYENLKVANEKLEDRDKMQIEFINTAAHEIRTPIQAILGYAEMALLNESVFSANGEYNKNDKTNTNRKNLNAIYRNAERLERLSKELLEISRIESNTLKLNKQEGDLIEILDNVVEDSQRYIDSISKKIKISLSFNFSTSSIENIGKIDDNVTDGKKSENYKKSLLIRMDKYRIQEVISNLLDNAIYFTHEGQIDVAIDMLNAKYKNEIKKFVTVSVKDTGSGIDKEILPKLFEKFATKSPHGSGLGLYISKGIVEAHGGKIWAENNKDGKGSVFGFSLPLN